MKKFFAFLLIFAMLLPLAACGEKPAEPATAEPAPAEPEPEKVIPPVEDGLILYPEQLSVLRDDPAGKYRIGANLDLGGAEWTPIDDFTGNLSGLWGGEFCYTISNFTIRAASSDEAAGFFRHLTGKVSRLWFRDVTVLLPEGFSGAAGVLAGTAAKDIEKVRVENSTVTAAGMQGSVGMIVGSTEKSLKSCYADGSVTASAASGASLSLGGAAGTLKNAEDTEVRTDLTLLPSAGSVLLGGIAGSAQKLTAVNYGGHIKAESASGGSLSAAPLCGTLGDLASESFGCARSFEVTGSGKNVTGAYAAEGNLTAVVNCVTRDISNLDETVLTEAQYAMRRAVAEYAREMATIPWTPTRDLYHDNGLDANGEVKTAQNYKAGEWYFGPPYAGYTSPLSRVRANISEDGVLNPDLPDDSWGTVMGNDCADLVYWSMQQSSAEGTFSRTADMVCENGLIPIGNIKIAQNDKGVNSTAAMCELNGREAMYESYALARMGDALLHGPDGHARIVAEAAYVFRRDDGSIDGAKSYLLTHEQGISVDKQERLHTSCKAYGVQTFEKLFEYDYIALTLSNYETGIVTPMETRLEPAPDTKDGLLAAKVVSNYGLDFIELTVRHGEETVLQKIVYPAAKGIIPREWKLSDIVSSGELSVLKAGETYEVTVYVNGYEAENLAGKITVKG